MDEWDGGDGEEGGMVEGIGRRREGIGRGGGDGKEGRGDGEGMGRGGGGGGEGITHASKCKTCF